MCMHCGENTMADKTAMRNRYVRKHQAAIGLGTVLLIGMLALRSAPAWADPPATRAFNQYDYLAIVRAYADTMLEEGCDIYGSVHGPLFAEALSRRTHLIPRPEEWQDHFGDIGGIRQHDRMLGGANPQHCLNLYQVLYALTRITGEKRYGQGADASLKFFFENCQSAETGLLYWGEHAGWDLRRDAPLEKQAGDIHEFWRPWILWDKSWVATPDPCRRFAEGLWKNQIGDKKRGSFSRHARISSPGAAANAPYARHGGFYIETWAVAYRKTQEPVFLQAIETVLDGLERARLHDGGYLTGGSISSGGRRAYDVSLAISLGNAAPCVPDELAAKMRRVAAENDQVFARSQAKADDKPEDGKAFWSNAYGAGSRIGRTNPYMVRYRQSGVRAYREAILRDAALCRVQQINIGPDSRDVWPGTFGDAVWLLLNAYELTGDAKYLEAADRFARKAVDLFLADDPLPKASHNDNHYEAVSRGDTLMMALLKLWAVHHERQDQARLVHTDR